VENSSLSGVNYRALMISYSEIGGHVLTPFLGMNQDGQGELIGSGEVAMLDQQKSADG